MAGDPGHARETGTHPVARPPRSLRRLLGWILTTYLLLVVVWGLAIALAIAAHGDTTLLAETRTSSPELAAVSVAYWTIPVAIHALDAVVPRVNLLGLAGLCGLVLAVTSFVMVGFLFLMLWITGEARAVVDVDAFGERELEIALFGFGLVLLPVLCSELDRLASSRRDRRAAAGR